MPNAIRTINDIARLISLKEDAFFRAKFPIFGSGSQYRTLVAISEISSKDAVPSSIAEHLGITKASVTGLTASLVKAKLIEEKPHPTDKRSHFLRLTPSGKSLLKRVEAKYANLIEGFLPDAATTKKIEAWLKALQPKDE